MGLQAIVNYSLNYVISRNSFKDGVFFMNATNRNTTPEFINQLLKLIGKCKDINEFIKKFQYKEIIILINDCKDLILYDNKNFGHFIDNLIHETSNLKILIINRNQDNVFLPQKYDNDVLETRILNYVYAAKLFKSFDKDSNLVSKYSVKDISNHSLFKYSNYTNGQIFDIYNKLKELKNLDETAKYYISCQHKHDHEHEMSHHHEDKSTELHEVMISFMFEYLKEDFSHEINIIFLIC